MTMRNRARIYVASSWRNPYQPDVVARLRSAGHELYDFRHPLAGYDNPNGLARGFHWSEIDPNWESWTRHQYVQAIRSPLAEQGFASDWQAMEWADTCVLVLPSGRNAHLEAGYFVGAGKRLFILMLEVVEPELMYRMATDICASTEQLLVTIATKAVQVSA